MRKRRMLSFAGILFLMVIMITACASTKSDKSAEYYNATDIERKSTSYNTNTGYDESSKADNGVTEEGVGASDTSSSEGTTDGVENSSALTSKQLEAISQEKIIKNFNLDVETQDFDTLIKKINEKINNLGGYIESSSINGNSYYDGDSTRNGNVVARIPSAKVDEFVNTVDENSNVVSNQSSIDNVTMEYIDVESRIKALKIEQERLFAILEKTDKLESIISLESRLSEIRYELQNYESQLRAYDNKVKYSTVTMNIREVERITPVVKRKPTFSSRIRDGVSDTVYNISEGFKNFLVWLIVNLPYLLIFGIIILIVVIVIRKIIKKYDVKRGTPATYIHNNKNYDSTESMASQEGTNHTKDTNNIDK